jgi:hypothetical protein
MNQQNFSFRLVNGSGSDIVVALLASPFFTLGNDITQSGTTPFAVSAVTMHEHDITYFNYAGVGTIGAIADDGTIATTVTATASISSYKIREFRNYVKNNPVVLSSLMLQVDNAAVFAETITYGQWSALGDHRKDYIRLQQYYDAYQQQSTKILITGLGIVFGPNTYMFMNIPAGRTVTFTYFFE